MPWRRPTCKVRLSRQVIVQTCGHGIQQGYALAIRMHQIQAEGGIAKRRILLHPLAVLIHRAGPFGDAHRGEHAAPPPETGRFSTCSRVMLSS